VETVGETQTSEEVDGAESVCGCGDGVTRRVPHFVDGAAGVGGAFDSARLVVGQRLAARAARHVFGADHEAVALALAERQLRPFPAGRSRLDQLALI